MKIFWVQHILWSSKILFCFWTEVYFLFFLNSHIRNVVLTLPNVVKIDVENDKVVSTLPNVCQFNVEIHKVVVERCKLQRWRTQRCFNVALTLCDLATSYVPKNHVKPTLKCLLERFYAAAQIHKTLISLFHKISHELVSIT